MVLRILPALLVGSLLLASPEAQAVDVIVSGPSITFSIAPRLVFVDTHVQVVEDYEHEVFFVNGFYWARHGDGWYRTRSHRGEWVYVKSGVPASLVRYSPGKFKHFKKAHHDGHGHGGHKKFKGHNGGGKHKGGKGKGGGKH